MQDPGENASFEARQAYAQWNLERKAEERAFAGEEENPLAAVFKRAEQARDSQVASVAGGGMAGQAVAASQQAMMGGDAGQGRQDQGGIVQELQKQTALLTQILAKIGESTFS
jgi:hypothetical protein